MFCCNESENHKQSKLMFVNLSCSSIKRKVAIVFCSSSSSSVCRSLQLCCCIMKIYNFHPLKPHFYIVKLGFTGVYIIFLILPKKNRDSDEYLQSTF